jgi:hypothetical protein
MAEAKEATQAKNKRQPLNIAWFSVNYNRHSRRERPRGACVDAFALVFLVFNAPNIRPSVILGLWLKCGGSDLRFFPRGGFCFGFLSLTRQRERERGGSRFYALKRESHSIGSLL